MAFIFDEPVLISGVFDLNTKNRIKKFKVANGLADNYSVDKETFDKIYSEYLLKRELMRLEDLSFSQFPKDKSYSAQMITFNKMLYEVLADYGVYTDLRALPFYYDETEKALDEMCRICGINASEAYDAILIDRVNKEYSAMKAGEKYFF